ncbi:AAEL012805-PA [Aedes aegypti]|uniref:AAEL012805-PA n=1 Tax=Aedes aegypti TaxID=7159 RepID=Q16L07_AEDAE|nr:AAEL012805-PA [Aedes aegypti]
MKPSSPVLQSITYSQYKSCNTLKYLISCTPCGLVTFISKAFPGRASDQKIVRKSGYLSLIKPGAGVLADRGFKNVASDVASAGGVLIRPPSVSNDEPLSKEDSLLAKEIASVRIHIERLIRRFREFNMCAPHAEISSSLFDKFDDIVIIVAGLVNLQAKLIR